MAKIDTSKITGYAEMSAEDKLKALEEFDIPEPDTSGMVSKEEFDKVSSQLAAKKKELRDKLSDDEAAKEKEQEEREKMQKELDTLRRESVVSKNKAKLIALGYEETLADETAEAMADGKIEKVFANQKKHLDAFEKKVRADALKDTPKPEGGSGGATMTLENLRKMSIADRLKYSQEHPEEYKELYTNDTGGSV